MKILIVSDTHGKDGNLLRAIEKEKPVCKIIHLGDICENVDYIEHMTEIPCFAVRGNNDWGSALPSESIVMVGSRRAFITHGHYYNVYPDGKNEDLREHAEFNDCDIAMYGHTHIPEIHKMGRITMLNPGSLTYPRQPGHDPSYIVAEIDETGNPEFQLKYL